jgi:cyclopropane fatty-acyl-phospholipid synthase-like methyltransferase
MPFRKSLHRDFTSYWDEYYKNNPVGEPSLFAQFVRQNYLHEGKSLLEIGCGNGRDAQWFSRTGLAVTGVDLSSEAIKHCREQVTQAEFFTGDFSELTMDRKFDYVYSRFTLHAVDEETECKTLTNVWNHLGDHGLFFVEARTILDELCGKGECLSQKEWIYNGHYRRFLVPENFLGRARKAGFSPCFIHMANGLAPWRDQDPIVMRAVFWKNPPAVK